MIADVRARYRTVLEVLGETVLDYLPDDLSTLPALVIDLPDGSTNPDVGPLGYDVDVDVFVIARRYGDADSSAELDELADRVVSLVLGQAQMNLDGWQGRTVAVAGNVCPCYVVNTSTTELTDCPTIP